MLSTLSLAECRGMQPANEKHLSVGRDTIGNLTVRDIDCARVYHVNTVMEIRTQVCSHTMWGAVMMLLLSQGPAVNLS